jgi:hypothetical protein
VRVLECGAKRRSGFLSGLVASVKTGLFPASPSARKKTRAAFRAALQNRLLRFARFLRQSQQRRSGFLGFDGSCCASAETAEQVPRAVAAYVFEDLDGSQSAQITLRQEWLVQRVDQTLQSSFGFQRSRLDERGAHGTVSP